LKNVPALIGNTFKYRSFHRAFFILFIISLILPFRIRFSRGVLECKTQRRWTPAN